MRKTGVVNVLMACVLGLALVFGGMAGTVAAEGEPASGGVTIQETGVAYNTIQEAIDAASADNTIVVAPGVYVGNISLTKAGLVVKGAKADVPAGGSETPANRGSEESVIQGTVTITKAAVGAKLAGFTIDNTGEATGNSGIIVKADAVVIENNVLQGKADFGAGIQLQSPAPVGPVSATISGNNIRGYKWGINLDGNPSDPPCLVKDNYVAGASCAGIQTQGSRSNSNVFLGNIVEKNASGLVLGQGEHELRGNQIRNNTGTGIYILATDRTYGIEIEDNEITDNGVGILFDGANANAVGNVAHRNVISGNTVAVQNQAAPLFDVTLNYWGAATGPASEAIVGSVETDPWYSDAGMTQVVSNKPVHNTTTGKYYGTIQDAIDAVYNATVSSDTTYTIEIAGGTYSAGPIQIKQQEHKSIVLQPAGGASVIFTGSAVVQIDGMGRFDGAESVTIKGITFDYRGAAGDVSCIAAFQVDPAQHHIYAHNIVADGCHFIGTGQASAKVVAVSTPSSGGHAGITLTGCTATNTYTLFSGYSTNLTVDECNVATIAGSGINEQSGGNLTVTNSDFDVTKYGIRSGSGHSAPVSGPAIVVNNSSIKASGDAQSDDEAPIVLRGQAPARVQVSHSALINPSHPVIVYNYAGSEFASQFDLALAVNYWESTASAEVGRPVAEMLRNLTLEQAGHDPWYKDVERTQLVSARPVVNETKLTLHDDIGSAIAAAGSGDVITVAAGTYNEKLTIDKAITLKGPNFGINPNTGTRGAEAIIGGEDQDGTILRIESPNVVIDGFTINSSDAGYPVYTGGTVVDGLTISNNIVGTGVRAVTIERSGSNVSILNNTLTGANYGMRVDGPSYVNLKINGNVIEGPITNSVVFNGTSVIEGFEFKNNTLTGRSANIAADIRKATVTGNVFTVTEGSYCLNINLHDGSVLSGNTFNGDSDTDGLRLWGTQYDLVPSSDTSIVGNTFNNCPRAITLSPGNRSITIGTNTFSGVTTQVWNAARLNGLYYGIQEAIDAASPDDTINVTAGIFTQNVTIPAGKNGLRLVGAGSSLTTISPPSGRALALLGNISADSPLRPITGIAVEGFTLHSVDLNGFITLSGEPDGEYYTKDLTLRDIVLDGCKYGVLLMSVDGATLDGVVVSNLHGTPETPVSALGLAGVKDLTATDCRFYNNDIAVSVGSTSVESDPAYRYGTNEGITVRWTVFSGNGIAVKNEDQNVSVLATSNYWGTGRTSPVSEIEGKVAFYPWYVSSSMTPQNLSNYVAPDDGQGGGGGPTTPPVQPPVIAGAVSQPVETTTGGTVALEDNSAKVELPPEAVPENVTVTLGLVTEMEQPTTGMIMIGNKVYEITAETEDGELVTQFQKPLTLTFTFAEEELEEAGTSAEDLMVFYWDAKAQAWIALPTTVDPVTGTVTAITDHFTVFALMAKPDMPALPDTKGHWAETHVLRLVSLGIVGGYEDGTFRPETGITREEFAKMVVLAAGLEPVAEPELGFSDADEIQGWARGYVAAAVEAGIITGLPENRFGPGERVTRQQAATMIGRALGVEVGAAGTPTSFVDDGDIESWALAALNLAVEKGLITGFPDNSFKPAENVTRAQAATMLAKLTVVRLAD